jgi:hypothetical protein
MSSLLMILLLGLALVVFLPDIVFAPVVFVLWLAEKGMITASRLVSFCERPCSGGSRFR